MTPDDRDGDIRDELDFHLEAEQEELEASGLSAQAARRAAHGDVGNQMLIQEAVHAVWTFAPLDAFRQDVRYAVRRLWKQRAFSCIAIGTLAIAIGAATAVYSFVDQVLLEPPRGIASPRQVVQIVLRNAADRSRLGGFSLYHYNELAASQTALSDLMGEFPFEAVLGSGDSAEQATVDYVTGNFFSGLGLRLLAGRGIDAADNVPNGPPSVVLTEHVWRQQFRAVHDIVGRTVALNGKPYTVVGVAADDFEGLAYSGYGEPDVFAAVHAYTAMQGTARVTRRGSLLAVVGRLKPGVSRETAEAQLSVAAAQLSYLPTDSARYDAVATFPLDKSSSLGRSELSRFLGALFAVSVLILLAACTNIANFLMSHGITRRTEMATRLALGASRRRLLQQLLTESLVLGSAAGALGMLLAVRLVSILEAYPPSMTAGYSTIIPIHLSAATWLFGGLATIVAIFAFGTLPAVLASKRNPLAAMKRDDPWLSSGRRLSVRHLLLAVQIAVSVALAAVATLYAHSLVNMNAVPFGMNTGNVLLARVAATALPGPQQKRFYQDLLDKLRAQPQVIAAAVASNPPLSIGGARVQADPQGPAISADFAAVGSSYFHTLGIPIVAGRDFEDGEAAARVESGEVGDQTVIISRTLGEKLWPGQSPLGRRLRIPGLPPPIGTSAHTVVGVVSQARCQDLSEDPLGCIYLPLNFERSFGILHIRTKTDPMAFLPTLRAFVHDFSPEIPLDRISTLQEHIGTLRAAPRVSMFMTAALAMLTAFLAIVGCVGLISSIVNEGRRGIAIRLALGCSGRRLAREILSPVVVATVAGIAAGGYGARLLAEQLVAPQLYHTTAADPYAFILMPVLFVVVGFAASYWPARAAARTDPAVMLRGD